MQQYGPAVDEEYTQRARGAQSRSSVLRYVAQLSPEGCSVGLKEVPLDSPLGRLQGTDNILAVKTSLYASNPLVIQGAGAGAGITAAGIVADMVDLAQSL